MNDTVISSLRFCTASTQTTTPICGTNSDYKSKNKSIPASKNFSIQHVEEGTATHLTPNQDPDPIQRRLNPKCKEDVKLLFSELNIWRKQNLDEIEQKRDISVEKRIELRGKILAKETFLLRKINKINNRLTVTDQKMKIDEILNQITIPKYWELSSGERIEVQTKEKEHSTELIKIYQKLDESREDLTVSQRIKLLTYAKEKLNNTSNCSTVKEICNLLDREKEFLRRGISQSLSGLRARISHLLLHFLERNIDELDLSAKNR